MVSEHGWDWYQCGQDLVILPNGRALLDGDIAFTQLFLLSDQFDSRRSESKDLSDGWLDANVSAEC